MPKETRDLIKILGERYHSKASEAYLDVEFYYPDSGGLWKGSVPYQYRRTGIFAESEEEKRLVLQDAYEAMHPSKREMWLDEQKQFWDQSNKQITRPFFDALSNCEWKCQACQLPQNPNWARRTQDIKELGYTFATDTSRYCKRCGRNTTHLIMLRIPRGGSSGYETWSPSLRKRILEVLGHWDSYECWIRRGSLLPDHKFPEIRWDQKTRQENPESMTDKQIKEKFQLFTNQRNQQKREVCRICFQTEKRGIIYGIRFFYEGDENWPTSVPAVGKTSERGCAGCGWYDINLWRDKFNEFIAKKKHG